jgi:hypothetical protein
MTSSRPFETRPSPVNARYQKVKSPPGGFPPSRSRAAGGLTGPGVPSPTFRAVDLDHRHHEGGGGGDEGLAAFCASSMVKGRSSTFICASCA